MKTVGSVFISGLDTYAVEPPMADGVLQIDGAYHVIGENRKAYDPDRTKTMDYYYLTLAAIAKEIEMRKYPRKDGSFILACGFLGNRRMPSRLISARRRMCTSGIPGRIITSGSKRWSSFRRDMR